MFAVVFARLPMDLSVYVHLPYCLARCHYCDFNTYAVSAVPQSRYLSALIAEARRAAKQPAWRGRPLGTVFLGGGTPSLFSPRAIGELLEALDSAFGIAAHAEITMEANPGAIEGSAEERLRGFRDAGVNRLSLGVQSLSSRNLEALGRIHSVEDCTSAIGAARAAGFDNLSCDLIFAVPGQTLADWQADLDALISLAPDHVSTYNLTYEEGTPITELKRRGTIEAVGEETELDMFACARRTLDSAGYRHYEVSNFARPGRECRHNLTYWTWRDYLGLGAGAHGFAVSDTGAGTRAASARGTETLAAPTVRAHDGVDVGPGPGPGPGPGKTGVWGKRYANERNPERYMADAGTGSHDSEETLDREMATSEYLMLALRLTEGFAEEDFRGRFGIPLQEAAPRLDELCREDLLVRSDGRVHLSERGLPLADTVTARLAAG